MHTVQVNEFDVPISELMQWATNYAGQRDLPLEVSAARKPKVDEATEKRHRQEEEKKQQRDAAELEKQQMAEAAEERAKKAKEQRRQMEEERRMKGPGKNASLNIWGAFRGALSADPAGRSRSTRTLKIMNAADLSTSAPPAHDRRQVTLTSPRSPVRVIR